MKNKIITGILILIFSLTLVTAQEDDQLNIESQLSELVGQELPGFLDFILKDEELINLEFRGKGTFGIKIEEGKITETSTSPYEDNTLDIFVSEAAVSTLEESEDFFADLIELEDQKEITISSPSFWRNTQIKFLNVFATIARWFT